MINETFVASSPKGAYEQALEKYGTNISLVSAKQVKHDDGVLRSEVIVAVDEEVFRNKSFGSDFNLDETISSEDQALMSEVHELKEQLLEMQKYMQEDSTVISKVKSLFEKKGISKLWLDKICQTLVDTEIAQDMSLLVSYLLEEIDTSLQIVKEDLSRTKVMMLVGPTGVGKTTTIAKLAARYAYLLDKPHKVLILNLDSYKIGAIEQLEHYSNIMQIEHVSLANADAFEEKLRETEGYDIILVDTAGMSPYDTQKFLKIVEYVKTDTPLDIEVNLVLSATVKYEDMEDIYQNFSFLNLHALILTKFDETKHFGTLLNFMLLYKLPMAYFTTGQEVPDDLHLAKKEFLLEHFIGDIDEG